MLKQKGSEDKARILKEMEGNYWGPLNYNVGHDRISICAKGLEIDHIYKGIHVNPGNLQLDNIQNNYRTINTWIRTQNWKQKLERKSVVLAFKEKIARKI